MECVWFKSNTMARFTRSGPRTKCNVLACITEPPIVMHTNGLCLLPSTSSCGGVGGACTLLCLHCVPVCYE